LRHGQLLEQALDMFLDRGYAQTTIDAIAAAVNMTKRTIYARYEDKAALFRAAVQHAIKKWVVAPQVLRALECDTLEDTLLAVARMRIAHAGRPESVRLGRVIAAESFRFPDIFTIAYEQGTMPIVTFVADLLRRYQDSGAIRVKRPQMAAYAFLSLVVGGPARAIATGRNFDPDEMEERIVFSVELFLNGIRLR
jgi:TetR/AcrR family transcriptional regulator, mexJK operon transcriptional repressor